MLKRALLRSICLLAAMHATPAFADSTCKVFATDAQPQVWINWDTFVDWGIDNNEKGAWEHAIRDALTRWEQVAGARIRPRFAGYTTAMTPGDNDILIRMTESFPGTDRPATTVWWCGSGNGRAVLDFHRKHALAGTPVNWVLGWGNESGEKDVEATAMHELGHTMGLDHGGTSTEDVMGGSLVFRVTRFGPSPLDRSRLVDLYGSDVDDLVKMRKSTDNGATWSAVTTNLTGNVETTNDPAAIYDALSNAYHFFYTKSSKVPCWWLDGSGGQFQSGEHWCFGGEDSFYGVAAAGSNNEFMWAWVDPTSNNMQIKVVRSTNGGVNWSFVALPASYTTGTPGLHQVSNNTWILAYAARTNSAATVGQIAYRVTTNDGASWSNENILALNYHAESGVTVTGEGNDVRIGFSYAARTFTASLQIRIATVNTTLSGTALIQDSVSLSSKQVRTQPAFAVNDSKYFYARRTSTSTLTSSMSYSGTAWSSSEVDTGDGTNAGPALAGDDTAHNLYLFRIEENH